MTFCDIIPANDGPLDLCQVYTSCFRSHTDPIRIIEDDENDIFSKKIHVFKWLMQYACARMVQSIVTGFALTLIKTWKDLEHVSFLFTSYPRWPFSHPYQVEIVCFATSGTPAFRRNFLLTMLLTGPRTGSLGRRM